MMKTRLNDAGVAGSYVLVVVMVALALMASAGWKKFRKLVAP